MGGGGYFDLKHSPDGRQRPNGHAEHSDGLPLTSNGGGDAASAASAGVPAKEEGSVNGGVGYAFLICIEGFRLGPEHRIRLPSPPPAISRNVSFASSAQSSRFVDEGQGGGSGQSATLTNDVFSAPNCNQVGAGGVKKELAVRPFVACSLAACSSVARSSVARPAWARPLVVPSSVDPNPVSYLSPVVDGVRGPLVELRRLGRQLVSSHPISNELPARYKPIVRRPVVLGRSSSLDVGPPSAGNTPRSLSIGEDDETHIRIFEFPGLEELIKPQFDDVLVESYGYPGTGRQLFPRCTTLFNKFAGVAPASGLESIASPVRFRNIRTGKPAIAHRSHVGGVALFEGRTFIHNLGGSQTKNVVFINAC